MHHPISSEAGTATATNAHRMLLHISRMVMVEAAHL